MARPRSYVTAQAEPIVTDEEEVENVTEGDGQGQGEGDEDEEEEEGDEYEVAAIVDHKARPRAVSFYCLRVGGCGVGSGK
jgi:hypothetical protein